VFLGDTIRKIPVSLLRDQVIKLLESSIELFKKPRISNISDKRLLNETEFALYLGRSESWASNLRKQGVLMDKKHYHHINGLVLYNREEIENDIIANLFR
jgi:hypothetical protein